MLSGKPRYTDEDDKGFTVYIPPGRAPLSRDEKSSAAKEAHSANATLQLDKLVKMLKLKDLDIQHLQQVVRTKDIALRRQEELMGQTKRRLIFQENSERVELEKKDVEIASLKAKNTEQGDKLLEQSRLLSTLHNQQKLMEQETVAYSQHVKRKVQKLRASLQFAHASLKSKDEELLLRKQCINAVKLKIWEREQMIQKMKREGEQLQHSVKRKDFTCKQLQADNEKLKGENFKIEKSLVELKRVYELESRMQASYLRKQQERIQSLEMALSRAESFLNAKNLELQASHAENMRIYEEHELLKSKYSSLMHDYVQLQTKVIDLEAQVMPNERVSGDSINYSGKQHQYEGCGCINVGKKYYGHGRSASNCSSGQKPGKDVLHNSAINLLKAQNDDMKFNGMISANFASVSNFPSVSLSAGTDCATRGHIIEVIPGVESFNDAMKTKQLNQNGTSHDLHSYTSLEIQAIQEEIMNREMSWKRIEARMRAELSRRVSQLHEAEDKCRSFMANV